MEKYTVITFPALGIEWNPAREITLGSFSIHFYGILIATGLLIALVYGWQRSRQFGLKEDHLTDGVLTIVPFAVLCARLYYCAFEWDQFKSNPISVLYIWQGGLAIYGGVIGAVIGMAVFARVKKLKLAAMMDLVALGFLIGQAMGRWGNFFNREAFGSEVSKDFFLAMGLYNTYSGAVEFHHPTFLYESLWNTVGFVLLHFLSKKRRYDGQIALGYAAWYGFGRTFIEGLRTDSLYWGDIRVSQLLAAVSCFAAVIVLLVLSFREHKPEGLFANQVAAREAEEARLAAEAEQATEEPTPEAE